jgi:Fe-S-cluster containining protein
MNHLSEKIKRAATSIVLPVEETRNGNCKNCGACCMFLYKCPFLKLEDESKALCTIHMIRPPMCRKYPRTKEEQIHHPCGYHFN